MSDFAARETIDVLREELSKAHARHDSEYSQLRSRLDTVIVVMTTGFTSIAAIFVIALIGSFNILGEVDDRIDNAVTNKPQKTIVLEEYVKNYQKPIPKEEIDYSNEMAGLR